MVTTTGPCQFDVTHSWLNIQLTDSLSSLGLSDDDKVTFTGNYIHHTSGRSPKLEYKSYWHVYNNYWFNNTGHAFDVGTGANVLIEGNVFEDVETPFLTDSAPGNSFAVSSSDVSTCDSKLGRTCAVNTLVSSGTLSVSDESVLTSWPSGESGITVKSASSVKSSVLSNAGIGKLSSSSSEKSSEKTEDQSTSSTSAYSKATSSATSAGSGPKSTLKTVGVKPTQAPQHGGAPPSSPEQEEFSQGCSFEG